MKTEIWYLGYFEYEELNRDGHFFCFQVKTSFFGGIRWWDLVQKMKIVR